MGGLNGFWYGSGGDCLVGQWHGRLAGALAEKPPVGCPVFALHGGGDGGAAEGVGVLGAARALGG